MIAEQVLLRAFISIVVCRKRKFYRFEYDLTKMIIIFPGRGCANTILASGGSRETRSAAHEKRRRRNDSDNESYQVEETSFSAKQYMFRKT